MKNIYLSFLTILVVLSSCTEEKKAQKEVESETSGALQSVDSSASSASDIATSTNDNKTIKDGKFESFYPDKTLKAEGMVTNGKREGIWTSYHPNGNKQSENEYVNGVLHGKTFTTYPNGQVMYIGYYYDGKYDGQWIYYTAEGELSKEIFYEKGELKQLIKGEDYNK